MCMSVSTPTSDAIDDINSDHRNLNSTNNHSATHIAMLVLESRNYDHSSDRKIKQEPFKQKY